MTRQTRHLRKSKKGHIFPAGRIKIPAITVAAHIIKKLQPFCQKITLAGSLRRKISNPHDIDIVLISKPGRLQEIQHKFDTLTTPTMYGDKKMSGKTQGYQVDLFFATPQNYESMLMFATGPAGANIKKRVDAKAKGWKLSQYGLFNKSGKRIASTEKDIYNKLGLTYRKPELRGMPR
jgi:DNA polymerase (family 10)